MTSRQTHGNGLEVIEETLHTLQDRLSVQLLAQLERQARLGDDVEELVQDDVHHRPLGPVVRFYGEKGLHHPADAAQEQDQTIDHTVDASFHR